jgi:hypothetical protein
MCGKSGEEAFEYRKLLGFNEIREVFGDPSRVYGGRFSKRLLARRRHRYRHDASIVVRSNALCQSCLDQSIDDARHATGGDQDQFGQIAHSDRVSRRFVQSEQNVVLAKGEPGGGSKVRLHLAEDDAVADH